MSSADGRARLAQDQAELIRALVASTEAPAGFDEKQVRLAARSLVNKRLREVTRAWPALANCLGEAFPARFTTFAEGNPPPVAGGPVEDGRAFAATLPASELDDDARLELLRASLHRRWLPLRLCWLPRAGRLVLGLRLPWLGARVMALRLRKGA